MNINNSAIDLNLTSGEYLIDCVSVDIHYRNKIDERMRFEIYTDGSKLNNKVGSAITVYKDQQEVESVQYILNDEASVFMAELFAIDKAIDYVIKNSVKYNGIEKYAIISDLLLAIQAIAF